MTLRKPVLNEDVLAYDEIQTTEINKIVSDLEPNKYETIWQGEWYTGGKRTLLRDVYKYSSLLVYTQLGGPTPVQIPITNLYTTLTGIGARVVGDGNVETYTVNLSFDRTNLKEVLYVTSRRSVMTTTGTVVSSGNAGYLTALVGVF